MSKLRSHISNRAAKAPCIQAVVADYRLDAVDLLFVVEIVSDFAPLLQEIQTHLPSAV